MGIGYICKCENCQLEETFYFGCGMLYFSVCNDTINEIKGGKYGNDIKNFFESDADSGVNCELVALNCPDCGNWDNDKDLSVIVPKEKGLGHRGVFSYDVENNCETIKKYTHHCKKCDGKMDAYNEKQFLKLMETEKVFCPHCNSPMKISKTSHWD